jgi:hypothetical protein
MVILPTDIRILFTNYDIIAYFLNLASCSGHFISIKHRILTTFNINPKQLNSDSLHTFKWLPACIPLSDYIISLRREVWVSKTNSTPPPFIKVSVPSQESVQSCLCVLGVSSFPQLLRFYHYISELFPHCGIFFSSFLHFITT